MAANLLDTDAYEAYLAHVGDQPNSEYLIMPGSAVFASLGNNLSGVNINPESEHSVHYGESQFEQLRRWGLAVEVERILAGESAYTKPFHLLRAFDGYRLIFANDETDGHRIALVPDLQGRPLLAVFTADDAVRAFIDDAEQPSSARTDGLTYRWCEPLHGSPKAASLRNRIQLQWPRPRSSGRVRLCRDRS